MAIVVINHPRPAAIIQRSPPEHPIPLERKVGIDVIVVILIVAFIGIIGEGVDGRGSISELG
jgi:hypothetical protein